MRVGNTKKGGMESCARKIHFCYGHRVMNHESKCATLHGHNGVIWVHATPVEGLDKIGRVIDFSVLKEKIGQWVDHHWDHTTILYQKDEATIDLIRKAPQYKDVFILETNPTAENLAHHLLWKVCPQLLQGLQVIVFKVDFWETENCMATQALDPNDPKVRQLYQLP